MDGAVNLILNGRAQTDIDMQGFKLLNLDTSNLGEFSNQTPFLDSEPLIKGSSDGTKQARFEVDGFSEEVIRVFTLPNYNAQLATLAGTEALTNKTLNGLTFSGSGGGITLDSGIISISDGALVTDGDVSILGSGASLSLLLTGNTSLTLPTSGTVAVTSQIPVVSDVAYNEATWNGNLDGATKNSIRDKIETLSSATSQPFPDNTALIKGSANSLKQFRIEVDQLSTGVRVMTPPDYDFTPASIDGAEDLKSKNVNGLTIAVGTAPNSADAPTYAMAPAQPFAIRLVAIDPQTGTTVVLRTTAPTDIVLPVSGILATVAGTIPFAYLSVNKDLDGGLASNVKVPTQLAIKTYVDARVGAGVKDTSDDTVSSATSVDLSVFDSTKEQIGVTGATDIEQFILDEKESKVLVFDDELTLVQGEFLSLKGGQDMIVKAGSYIIVKGLAAGVVEVNYAQDATGYKEDTFKNIYLTAGGNIGFADILTTYFDIGRSSNPAELGMFMRITEGDYPTLVKHDLTASVSLEGSLLTSARTIMFPDSDGTFGLLVSAPVLVNDPGEDGMWAKDAAFLYIYDVGEAKWGRVGLNYSW